MGKMTSSNPITHFRSKQLWVKSPEKRSLKPHYPFSLEAKLGKKNITIGSKKDCMTLIGHFRGCP
jgi:hypothetical protein